jgi:adenosylhomocysteinase
MIMSVVRHKDFAPEGKAKIDWVAMHMPVLGHLRERYRSQKPFSHLNISVCLHLEAKTAFLCQVLMEGGARVAISGSNPLSTQDDVAAALAASGVAVYAWHNATAAEYEDFLKMNIEENKPQLLIDDGGDLVTLLHSPAFQSYLPAIMGGAEETTTGLLRLRAMVQANVLTFPMIAVNDAYCKYLFDNRYGTGQSVWDGIMRTTNLLIAGKNVVVAGYGWCGKGVASRARGLGANVIVTEVDPIHALEALMDGFRVMPMLEAAPQGDIFVTVTSCLDAIGSEHISVMKDGAVLCNAGHFDVEIDKKALAAQAQTIRTIKKNIAQYQLKGRSLFLLAEGRLVNLASGDGHPIEIMDLSFALQALSLEYLVQNKGQLQNDVIKVPYELDQKVAELKLAAAGIKIDTLNNKQKAYLTDFELQG